MVRNVSENKYKNLELSTSSVEEFLDYYLMIMNQDKHPSKRLDPKKIEIIRELIIWQGSIGEIKTREEWEAFRDLLIKKKVIPNKSTLASHKTKLKADGWVKVDGWGMKVSRNFVEGAKEMEVTLTVKYERPEVS